MAEEVTGWRDRAGGFHDTEAAAIKADADREFTEKNAGFNTTVRDMLDRDPPFDSKLFVVPDGTSASGKREYSRADMHEILARYLTERRGAFLAASNAAFVL